MGCTSSKENTNPPTTKLTEDDQPLINDEFRDWLKSHRPKVDEDVLRDVLSTAAPSDSDATDEYRAIIRKALDLLVERSDIKSTHKLSKGIQKEVTSATPKRVAHTIDVLKQTADKLRREQITGADAQHAATLNGQVNNDKAGRESKHGHTGTGEAGIVLKEALETARILFYKGKQAAIFANPNGGYDVRIVDDNDDALNQDGNLLRSIIVTEVKMRPKPAAVASTAPLFTVPPPPSARLLNEHEISDDFRRSIDAALKGLETIYHSSAPTVASSTSQQIHVDRTGTSSSSAVRTVSPSSASITSEKNNTANLTSTVHQLSEHGQDIKKLITHAKDEREQQPQPPAMSPTDGRTKKMVGFADDTFNDTFDSMETKDRLHPVLATPDESIDQSATASPTSPNNEAVILSSPGDLSSSVDADVSAATTSSPPPRTADTYGEQQRPYSLIANDAHADKDQQHLDKQTSLDQSGQPLTQTDPSNQRKPNLSDSLATSTVPAALSDERHPIPPDCSSAPVVTVSNETNATVKSPSHNVTYTEIIHSESHDGEQSRRFITESYDGQASNENDSPTTRQVITKSEFSTNASLGEKTMEQSVQVITVKVRNETTTGTVPSPVSDERVTNEPLDSTRENVNTRDNTI